MKEIYDINDVMRRFGTYLMMERGLSRNTVEAYTDDVQKLLTYLHDDRRSPADATEDDLHKLPKRPARRGHFAKIASPNTVGYKNILQIPEDRRIHRTQPYTAHRVATARARIAFGAHGRRNRRNNRRNRP